MNAPIFSQSMDYGAWLVPCLMSVQFSSACDVPVTTEDLERQSYSSGYNRVSILHESSHRKEAPLHFWHPQVAIPYNYDTI